MAFRIQDLMMDVRPGGWQMANPECTCQVTAKTGGQRGPGRGPRDRPGRGHGIPDDNPGLDDTIPPSVDCPPDGMSSLAADLAALRAQLRRDLGQSA